MEDKITREEINAIVSLNRDRNAKFLKEYFEDNAFQMYIDSIREFASNQPTNPPLSFVCAGYYTHFEFGVEVGRLIERKNALLVEE